jgi:hypothetical protein
VGARFVEAEAGDFEGRNVSPAPAKDSCAFTIFD